jgi:hypothetical protein
MGVTLKDARVEVEKIIGRGSGFVAVEIPFTPRAKRVLELSLEEARALGELPSSAASVLCGSGAEDQCAQGSLHGGRLLASSAPFPSPPWLRWWPGVIEVRLPPARRPQLHWHRAHPAGPAARGRGRGQPRARDAWRRPAEDPHAGRFPAILGTPRTRQLFLGACLEMLTTSLAVHASVGMTQPRPGPAVDFARALAAALVVFRTQHA